MNAIITLLVTHTIVFGGGWYFGYRQAKRGLPLISSKPKL